jgi:hypothetical protein
LNDSIKVWLWRTAITLAIIVIFAAGFYAEENGRGVRAWQKCERDLAARGETLDWTNYIPAPVPDEQNFFKAPSMSDWFTRHETGGTAVSFQSDFNNRATFEQNLTEITASNYLAWAEGLEPQLQLIRDALKRPLARMDGDYSQPFRQPLLNFVSYRVVAQMLAHRAKCDLVMNEPDKALEDLTLLHGVNQTIVKSGERGMLVAAMIHVAIAGLYVDGVADGLQSRSWREPELTALQKQLSEINLLPNVANAFRSERAGFCRMLDAFSLDEVFREERINTNFVPSDIGWWFVPSGWVYENKALIVDLEGELLDCMDVTNLTLSPTKAKASYVHSQNALRPMGPDNFIAVQCLPNFSKAVETMARNQTWADQARIACALERYRLANGNYPAALAALVPHFIDKIPHDIINGLPMSYSCADGQNFKLWSVGWNEIDDGGITQYTSDGKEDRDFGDWAWHYPAF